MPQITKIVASMSKSPTNVRFSDLVKVCDHYFGEARQQRSPVTGFTKHLGLVIRA